MKPPFIQAIPSPVSHDTVTCLEHLLDGARRGAVIGIAYAAMLKHRSYVLNACGEAHRSPTFARGMVAALDDELAARSKTP